MPSERRSRRRERKIAGKTRCKDEDTARCALSGQEIPKVRRKSSQPGATAEMMREPALQAGNVGTDGDEDARD